MTAQQSISIPGGGAYGRSAEAAVRNPVLALPAAIKIRTALADQPELRSLFGQLFRELAEQADERAHDAWRKRKGLMAAYWRAVCTYATPLARVIDPWNSRTEERRVGHK